MQVCQEIYLQLQIDPFSFFIQINFVSTGTCKRLVAYLPIQIIYTQDAGQLYLNSVDSSLNNTRVKEIKDTSALHWNKGDGCPQGKKPQLSFQPVKEKGLKHFLLLVRNIQKLIQKGFNQARFHPRQAAKLSIVIQAFWALTYVKYIS